MTDTHTFTTSDGRFIMTVNKEFLDKVPNPETMVSQDLFITHRLNLFLHNPIGPAITRVSDNRSEYWLRGQMVSKEKILLSENSNEQKGESNE